MKKTVTTAMILILTAAVIVFCFFMPEFFLKELSKDADTYILNTERIEYKGDYDIIEALGAAEDSLSGYIIYDGMEMEPYEVLNDVNVFYRSMLSENIGANIAITEYMPYHSASGDRIIWLCFAKIDGIDNKVTFLYDDKTSKVINFESDTLIKTDGGYYTYEDISGNEYNPDDDLLNEAYMNAEGFITLYAKYLDLTVGEVYFDHFNQYRYTFNAELYGDEGKSITVKISYNIENGKYNFNY